MKLEASRFIAESYFDFHTERSKSNVGTSKKSFAKYPGRPSAAQISTALLQTPPADTCRIPDIFWTHLLPQWQMHLLAGSNLALYGYGSKTQLLSTFIQKYGQAWHVFRMKAFDKAANFGDLLMNALRVFNPSLSQNIRKLPEIVQNLLRAVNEPVLLVIEMVDAPCMRSADIWKCLSKLADQSKFIQLILTFEHTNSLLLGESKTWARLNLTWHDATTFVPYSEELRPLLMGGRGSGDEDSKWQGAHFVLSSLTKTARSVFRVLAEHQLHSQEGSPSQRDTMYVDSDTDTDSAEEEEEEGRENGEHAGSLGVVAWYQKCQEQFLVSNEIAFRTQLTEFVDHELVRAMDDAAQNGTEFYIPFSTSHIKKLLDICE